MISRLSTSFLIWMYIILTVVLLETSASSDRVLLRDLSEITLHEGEMTTGRRSAPTPQLNCIGGSAKGQFTPKVVKCVNQGYVGSTILWRCNVRLPDELEFGGTRVACEGYSYKNDPFILKGSCGLEYELEYTSETERNLARSRKSSKDRWVLFATFVFFAFITYIIYAMWFNRNQNPANTGYRAGGRAGGPGGPGSGGGGPGGYPSAPPPFDDNYGKPHMCGFRGDSQSRVRISSRYHQDSQGSSSGGASPGARNGRGGGFWTGACLGVIGGYLANSFLNNRNQ